MTLLLVLLALAQDDESAFPAKLGYEWQYEGSGPQGSKNPVKKIIDVEIVGGAECFIVEDTGYGGLNRKMWIDVNAKGVQVHRMSNEINGSFTFLKFPLKKGDKWESDLKIVDQDDPAKLAFEVQDEEELETPAGKFKAIRVFWTAKQGDIKVETTSWYAAGQGEIARKVKLTNGDEAVDAYEFKLKERAKKKVSVEWKREAGPCKCADSMGKGVCKCAHCAGADKEAKCYCGTGGCKCGTQMPECNCRHCSGCTGGDDGKGGCSCGK